MSAMPTEAIRPATLADATGIGVTHVRSWQSAYQGLLPQEYLGRLDPAECGERWRQILGHTDWSLGGVLVLTAETGITGFAAYGPTRDEDEDPARTGELRAIYLLPEAWGTGRGEQLMTLALTRLAAAGYVTATLWVLDSNARARRFYATRGWAEDGAVKRDDRLGFPMAEVRYRRPLPEPDTAVGTG